MKIVDVKWGNEKTVLTLPTAICDCGDEMRLVGRAGCSHDDEWTYFLQCGTCKIVETTWQIPQNLKDTYVNMGKYGWKKL